MIFTGTNVRIELDTGVDLQGATEPKVRWRRKDSQGAMQSGEWDASIDETKVVYNTSKSDLDYPDIWEFQPTVIISGNLYKGRIVRVRINTPIKTEE